MKPATAAEAREAAADVVIVADTMAGFAEGLGGPRRRNPLEYSASDASSPPPKRGKSKKWSIEEAGALYDGHEGMLIRTALIRPPNYREDASPTIRETRAVVALCAHLKHSDQEHMVVISLNSQNRVVAIYEVGVGTRSSAQVDMRDIVKTLILSGGAGVIIVHNHPSGNPAPSQQDLDTTRNIKAAIGCLGCQMLDHVIIARDGYTSFFERGIL